MSIARLLGAILAILLLLAGSAWYGLLHTQTGARWLWSQAESITGGALTAGDVRGDLGSGVSVTQLSYVADGVAVTAATATVDATLGLLPLTIYVGTAHVSGLTVDLRDRDSAENDAESKPFRLEILQLPFELSIAELKLDDAKLVRNTRETIVTIDHATMAARWAESIGIDNLDLQMPGIDAAGNGLLQLQEPYDIRTELEVRAQPDVTGLRDPVAFRVASEGPLDDFTIEADSDEPRAELSGQITDITQSIRWDLELEVTAAKLPPAAKLPDAPPITVSARGQGGMTAFTVDAAVSVEGTDASATLGADVDLASETIDGNVDWSNAQWPLAGAAPRVASRRGRLAVSGSLDDWAIDGTLQLRTAGLPPGQLTVDGAGNRRQASVRIIEGSVLGGSVAGRAEYSWHERPAFSASLDLENVESDALLPDWPATLSGHVDVRGQQGPFALSIVLENVEGEFLDKPLRAAGGIGIQDGVLSADELSIAHGEASLHVSGNPYASGGLRYSTTINELGDYVDAAYGTFTASGALSLRPEDPYLEISASSPELGYGGTTIFDLELADRNRDEKMIAVEITASSVQYDRFIASDVRIGASGDRQQQAIELEFATDGLQTMLALDGAIDDWQAPDKWTGQIQRLQLEHTDFSAGLADPSTIVLTARSASVDDLCIANERGGSLCANASWARSTGARLSANLSSVPASLINAFVQTGFGFNQMLSGEMDWRMAKNGRSSGWADVTMSSGTIASTLRPDLKLETGEANLRFRIDRNSLRSGILKVPLPGLGQVAGQFDVLGAAGEGPGTLQGTIDVDISDVRFLQALVPVLDDVEGRLVADFLLSGPVSQPVVTGNVSLDDGAVSYLPIGLELKQVSLDGKLGGAGDIEITGSFVAGDGRGQIRTRTKTLDAARRGLQIDLQGENLTLIDVPDLKAVANTDATIGFDGETLQLDGQIDFPYARIKPQNIGINRVSASNDVIIVKGELPDGPAGGKSDADILFEGAVELSLGNDVVVDLDVADAKLSGSAVFTWNGPPMPTANGRYVLIGEILAYGQKLEISEGAIRFPDVPANDPNLRIRAEREIFGNTQVRRAGVLVSGSASRPTIEAYTTPMTTEERALTLLVTGSEFDYEKGVGAFDFGTYIAPRVYASYGIGLFDQENVIRVRYDLTEGFGLTLTSGARDEGVDLTYRFEN